MHVLYNSMVMGVAPQLSVLFPQEIDDFLAILSKRTDTLYPSLLRKLP